MKTLLIRQVKGSDPPEFEVMQPGGRAAPPVRVPSPVGFPVAGRPGSDLLIELRWYLERFLDYPFPPETEHADHVLAALADWGTQAFDALFDHRDAAEMLQRAKGDRYEELVLQVWSDEPSILAWPWEALRDPRADALAITCRIERRLDRDLAVPPPLVGLPDDAVHILLVTARPYEDDVDYRSISRPLVELVAAEQLPARVHVLRPPTLGALRAHLHQNPGRYHILHFDGHGGYGTASGPAGTASPSNDRYQGAEGRLVFEADDGSPDLVTATTLGALLREHRVPVVVLNACQSAMVDGDAANQFASVATALLHGGTRSVVAMAYSLYVSGGQQFLPAFYRRLFETGSVAEATRAGRQQMYAERQRTCARDQQELHDWLVPVLYQHGDEALSFVASRRAAAARTDEAASVVAPEADLPHGFVGRDGPLLALERALRLPCAAILVHGLGGVGKTTLAVVFVRWLRETGGLANPPFWISFQEVRSAEYVWNQLGEPIFGPQFGALPGGEKPRLLAERLRQECHLVVWDNFEVVMGWGGETAALPPPDREQLRAFVKALRGGATKILITSRSDEDWLGAERRKVALQGLRGEERWDYCRRLLRDLGIHVKRTDPGLSELMKLLDGHPLAMRVVLPRLETQRPSELIKALRDNFAALPRTDDEAEARLYATLALAEDALPPDLRELLIPLALHERFVNGDLLEMMAKPLDAVWTRERVDRFLATLAAAGLIQDRGQSIYDLHPALSGFLRATVLARADAAERDRWSRRFINLMARLADALAPRELHVQRGPFQVHGASFRHALAEAQRLATADYEAALTQALAAFAQNNRSFSEASSLFEQLASIQEGRGDDEGVAAAYHQLGIVAQEQRDFAAAEAWYKKSLAIKEKHGNEHGAAVTYHQLGIIAQEQRDFAAAEAWYKKSLAIEEKHGNEHGAAMTYHQLGIVAEEQRDFAAAEAWYKKSLAIKEKHGNEHGAAMTYHQLGMIAEEQRDFAAAEAWYKKSLAISEKHGNDHHAASTYHQLGMIAQEQRDFVAAEAWYKKSLAIEERQGNEHGASGTYHQLGTIAQEQRDFAAAEAWYKKSLAIEERLGNEHSAAITNGQLGILAGLQGNFEESARWLVKCIAGFRNSRDPASVQRNAANFAIFYRRAPRDIRPKLRRIWESANLGPPPDGTW